jgi:putative transposase
VLCAAAHNTYIHTFSGFAYLATVIDLFSSKVVGWMVADHMRTGLVLDALDMALAARRPGIGEAVMHTDRGTQYTSHDFRDRCLANGVIPPVGRTGTCYDNAAAESFNATIKKELIHQHLWLDAEEARSAVFDYIERYYNHLLRGNRAVRPLSLFSSLQAIPDARRSMPRIDRSGR